MFAPQWQPNKRRVARQLQNQGNGCEPPNVVITTTRLAGLGCEVLPLSPTLILLTNQAMVIKGQRGHISFWEQVFHPQLPIETSPHARISTVGLDPTMNKRKSPRSVSTMDVMKRQENTLMAQHKKREATCANQDCRLERGSI